MGKILPAPVSVNHGHLKIQCCWKLFVRICGNRFNGNGTYKSTPLNITQQDFLFSFPSTKYHQVVETLEKLRIFWWLCASPAKSTSGAAPSPDNYHHFRHIGSTAYIHFHHYMRTRWFVMRYYMYIIGIAFSVLNLSIDHMIIITELNWTAANTALHRTPSLTIMLNCSIILFSLYSVLKCHVLRCYLHGFIPKSPRCSSCGSQMHPSTPS